MVEKGVGIKLIRSGLYGGDMGGIYFIFFSIFKLIEIIFKLLDKYQKNDGNDMVSDIAQRERSNIKCYISTFSII